mgnify:FL=1
MLPLRCRPPPPSGNCAAWHSGASSLKCVLYVTPWPSPWALLTCVTSHAPRSRAPSTTPSYCPVTPPPPEFEFLASLHPPLYRPHLQIPCPWPLPICVPPPPFPELGTPGTRLSGVPLIASQQMFPPWPLPTCVTSHAPSSGAPPTTLSS